jgi:hypothetical protein
MHVEREWLANYSWDFVTAQNAMLCEAKSALHKPTSDGHEPTKALWESRHREPMTLEKAVSLCRSCHRLAPFCFYNGNTFTAIIRDVIRSLNLPADQAVVVRSLAEHIVAGVASEEEEAAFRKFCEGLR